MVLRYNIFTKHLSMKKYFTNRIQWNCISSRLKIDIFTLFLYYPLECDHLTLADNSQRHISDFLQNWLWICIFRTKFQDTENKNKLYFNKTLYNELTLVK